MTKLSRAVHGGFILDWLAVMDMKMITTRKSSKYMKIKSLACSTLAIALLAGCTTERHEHDKEAKISKEDATRTALAQVPNGMVKEAELEKEHGKLIWSFDIATPGTKDITEVNVDAISGQVVSTDKETPDTESKEKGDKGGDKD